MSTELFTPDKQKGPSSPKSAKLKASKKASIVEADEEDGAASTSGVPGEMAVTVTGRRAAARSAPRPWERSASKKKAMVEHMYDMESTAPKGWSLKHVLNKATWGINFSKVFAPHIDLNDPNRVKVGVRVRPLSESEQKRGETKAALKEGGYIKMFGTQIRIVNPRPAPGQDAKVDNFAFDQLYGPDTTTAQVFQELAAPLVHTLVGGFNGTIFAYGQTGSGKTHSMMGNASDPGVTPRVATHLFEVLQSLEAQGGHFEVHCSYLQIYREVLHDLLSGTSLKGATAVGRDGAKDLKIRRDPQRGIYVENLSEIALTTGAELTSIIEQGNKRRATSATLMNAESSRSHAVVILKMERTEPASTRKKGKKLQGKLNLVDLAGSERVVKSGATGESLKEAIAINQSLSMLGNVINALTDARSSAHIPYRSSKLTYLLEESLGGNSHTVMLAAMSPSARSYFETMNTLNYAVRAKLIQCNPKSNMDGGELLKPEDAEVTAEAKKAAEFYYLPRHVRHQHQSATPRGTKSSGISVGSLGTLGSASARPDLPVASHATVKVASKEEILEQKKAARERARLEALGSENNVRGTRTGAGAALDRSRTNGGLFSEDDTPAKPKV